MSEDASNGPEPGQATFVPEPKGTLLPDGTRWGPFKGAEFTDTVGVFERHDVDIIASGFRWTEGPTWVAEAGNLLFSDTIDARIYQWNAKDGVTTVCEVSGGYDGANVADYDSRFEPGSNGMALVGDDLYICQHPTHRVVKVQLSKLKVGQPFCDNDFEVIADAYQGENMNSPNDVIAMPNGDVFFSDPIYGLLKKQPKELGFAFLNAEKGVHPDQPYLDESCQERGPGFKGVYRWREGKLELVTKELDRPNGLAVSPDGKILWVANSSKDPSWHAFEMSEELPLKQLYHLDQSILGPLPDPGLGTADGFKVDEQGRLWTTIPAGIAVIDTEKKAIVAKVIFGTNTSNIQFGDGGDVFVTGLGHLWRLYRKI